MDIQRKEFVEKCGELLCEAKPNLIKCELKLGKDVHTSHGQPPLIADDEYVVVTCENTYTYTICVEGNTLCGIAAEIFSKMLYK